MSFLALGITLIYPFAKRWMSMPQAVLGLAFSFGIPMAFAAVQGHVPLLAWALMAANLFWVLAYDTEYAMVDRDDDMRIGMKTSAITLGRWDVAAVMVFYALYLLLWGLCLWSVQSSLNLWQWAMAALALAQVIWHFRLIARRSRDGCFKAFRINHWLGLTAFAAVLLA
jgi:4-hydroxybenzoate polyprenyltransferase